MSATENAAKHTYEKTYRVQSYRSSFYESLENARGENGYEALVRDLDFSSRPLILDAGCGEGRLLKYLPKDPFTYVGLDVSERAVKIGANVYSGQADVQFVQSELSCIPFPESKFNLVLSHMVFALVNNVDDCLREIFRVLAPGGVFRIFTPAYWRLESSTEAVKFLDVMRFLSGIAPNPDSVGIGNQIFRSKDLIERSILKEFGKNVEIQFEQSDFHINQEVHDALQIFSIGMYQFHLIPNQDKGEALRLIYDKILSIADEAGVVQMQRPMELITIRKPFVA